ncbi:MAG: dihydropteroate synthase [Bacteroidetes bacterium]|jgi:5-methyltetrahydrofolate--homocysteine methyltransferase|nr:dihydropteroate synthase [Bacteroidota bacterium]
MNIVGELINASRKKIRDDIKDKNYDVIARVAKDQFENGADFIDVNAGIFVGHEADYMKWLIQTVQENVDAPCCIDTPDPQVLEEAIKVHKGTPMLNSISLEKDRYDKMIPILKGTDMKVIALCMSDTGMPYTREDRMKIADQLINNLVQNNVKLENIYVDPLVQPIGSGDNLGMEFLNTVEEIHGKYEGIHTVCGLSNISFGIPSRKFMNQSFMIMAITKGLDSAIMNPMDQQMMANIIAAETLAGKDPFCEKYMNAYREGMFEFK